MSAKERLFNWFENKHEEYMWRRPMLMTIRGRKDRYADIDDASDEAEEQLFNWYKASVEELKTNFDYNDLDEDARLSYDVWIAKAEVELTLAPFRHMKFFFEHVNGPHDYLPTFMINFHKVGDSSDAEAYIARIGGIARYLDQVLCRARKSAQRNVRPPKFTYEIAMDNATRQITGFPFDSDCAQDCPVWADIKSKISNLLASAAICAVEGERLLDAAKAMMLEKFLPAYRALISWLKADVANTDSVSKGVGSFMSGHSYYQACIYNITTLDLGPQEIHEMGVKEVQSIRAEMEDVIARLGFRGSINELLSKIRTSQEFQYSNDDAGRSEYLEDVRNLLDSIKTKLPQYFNLLPKADLVVRRVEAFRERGGAPQHYFPGSPDGARPGVFYAHLSDMSTVGKESVECIAFHEGIPGHHLQISIQLELEKLPSFRKLPSFISFIEGWALYAEYLAKEMGGYKSLYSEIGRLGAELWRAARLVIDTGIHVMGWSEEDAKKYLKENSLLSDSQVEAEVRRYFVMPAQALAYKVGMLKILELRSKAESTLKERFDIKAFHGKIINGGSLPLQVLERVIDDWITEQSVKQPAVS